MDNCHLQSDRHLPVLTKNYLCFLQCLLQTEKMLPFASAEVSGLKLYVFKLVILFVFVVVQIFFPPELGSMLYKTLRSSMELPWSYSFMDNETASILWKFSGWTNKVLAIKIPSKTHLNIHDSNFKITGQATLVLKEAKLINNGSYTLKITLLNGSSFYSLPIRIVILGE